MQIFQGVVVVEGIGWLVALGNVMQYYHSGIVGVIQTDRHCRSRYSRGFLSLSESL